MNRALRARPCHKDTTMFGFLRAFKRTDASSLLARIAEGEVVLVDVRDPAELASTGRAEGAINLPLSRLRSAADMKNTARHEALSAEKPVALYCASGARSAQGLMILRKLGYRETYNLGGLAHWQAAGDSVKR